MAADGSILQSSALFLAAAVIAVPIAQRAGLGSFLVIYSQESQLALGGSD